MVMWSLVFSVSSTGEIMKSRQTIQPVGVDETVSSIPSNYLLLQNYPNPFNPSTKISYSIPHKSFVTLKVYDPLGSIAAELVREEKEAGRYELDFNAVDLSSGVYFYKIEAGDFIQIKKMILIK